MFENEREFLWLTERYDKLRQISRMGENGERLIG